MTKRKQRTKRNQKIPTCLILHRAKSSSTKSCQNHFPMGANTSNCSTVRSAIYRWLMCASPREKAMVRSTRSIRSRTTKSYWKAEVIYLSQNRWMAYAPSTMYPTNHTRWSANCPSLPIRVHPSSSIAFPAK